ncbi:hypothetical protein Tco_1371398 [Tanacetum coccineum]
MAALQYKDDHNRIAYLGREKEFRGLSQIFSAIGPPFIAEYAFNTYPPSCFTHWSKNFGQPATERPNASWSRDLSCNY